MAKLVVGKNKKVGIPAVIRGSDQQKACKKFYVDEDGYLRKSRIIPDFSNVKFIEDDEVLYYGFRNSEEMEGVLDFSSLEYINGHASCSEAFRGCKKITSVKFPSLWFVQVPQTASSFYNVGPCSDMFSGCTGLKSFDLSNLVHINGDNACSGMFYKCTGLKNANLEKLRIVIGEVAASSMLRNCKNLETVNLSSLEEVSGSNACSAMFESCGKLKTVSFDNLQAVVGTSAFDNLFRWCENLESVTFPKLRVINGNYAFCLMLGNCPKIKELSFPSLVEVDTNYTNIFKSMLSGCTDVTVHFKSSLQSVIGEWSDVTSGFGGTNTTVLFDLD